MTDFDMPNDVRNAIKSVAEKESRCFQIREDSETSISLMLDVASHPEPDCKYVSQILFDWDIPLPGQLLCYASVGIWNPPAPSEGFSMTPYIAVSRSGEEEYHQMILRHIAVPAEIANIAVVCVREVMEGILKALKDTSLTFSTNHFDDDKAPISLLETAFHGLIESNRGRVQWGEVIQTQKPESL